MSLDPLFQPFTSRGLTLPNRIVMAPMTRCFSPGGVPTDDVAAYYRRRAENDVGLIVTEGTSVDRPWANSHPDVPRFSGDALPAWKKVVDDVHAVGGRIAPQLWHTGSQPDMRVPWPQPDAVDTPSATMLNGDSVGSALTESGVADLIAAYARGAAAARELGFDAVEIHAAHGYLIDQFFYKLTNKRDDSWGGPTIGDRAKFGAEVIRAMRAELGPDIPLIARISQWKLGAYDAKNAHTPEELAAWVEPLVDAGADIIHCSQRRFWEPEFEGSDLNMAGWVKKLTGVATITVGSVGLSQEFLTGPGGAITPVSMDAVNERLARGEFDLVAVGRALIPDPAWASKVKNGKASELVGYSAEHNKVLF